MDTPSGCPATGGPLRFTAAPQLAIAQHCFYYTADVDTGTATAMCYDPSLGLVPSYGPADGGFSPLTLAIHSSDEMIMSVALSPEGDSLFTRLCGTSCGTSQYSHDATGWSWKSDLTLPAFPDVRFSTPTRRPNRHMMIVDDADAFHELVEDDAGAWQDIGPVDLFDSITPPQQFGPLYLSSDGLRLVFTTMVPGVYYADRPSLDSSWSLVRRVEGVPTVPRGDAFLADDCSRLYYSTDSGIVYVE